MRSILAVIMVLASSVKVDATSVVLFWTPTTIFMGADSKAVRDDGTVVTVCKIGAANDTYWAMSGILEWPASNFSADKVALDNMSTPLTLKSRLERFESAVKPELLTVLNAVRSERPLDFRNAYQNDPALEVAFADFEDGIPRAYVRYFVTRVDLTRDSVYLDPTRIDFPNREVSRSGFAALGRHEAIDALRAANPSFLEAPDVLGTIRRLIEIEIAAVPTEVGPPIALVEIDKEGAHWKSKGACGAN
ncbi:MAG TPA: hypothetical protein VLX09_11700 [Stellaceae bacterium]|nr:hypothetical protein [Stellaceae bacterium]